MKCFILIFLVTYLFHTCYSQQFNNPSPRIINGTVASSEQTKFQVSIRLKSYDSKFGNGHICGGTLIGPRKVLTAAHCLYNTDKKRYRKANEFRVVMGTLNRYERGSNTIVSDVTSIDYTGGFDMKSMRDDVGVMFLKTGLPANKTHPTVAPITLSNITTPNGASCRVSGWGTTEKVAVSSVLLVANVSIISRTICSASYGKSIVNGMICAGHLLGGTDSCQGDSGGPLVYNNTLVGVVSWGNGCAEPGFPGVYADVQYYYEWIMTRNSGSKVKTWSLMSFIVVLIYTL